MLELEKYRISRIDENNFVLEQKHYPDPGHRFAKQAEPKWVVLGYYPRLEYIAKAMLRGDVVGAVEGDLLESVKRLADEVSQAHADLSRQLTEAIEAAQAGRK